MGLTPTTPQPCNSHMTSARKGSQQKSIAIQSSKKKTGRKSHGTTSKGAKAHKNSKAVKGKENGHQEDRLIQSKKKPPNSRSGTPS